jgi:hypothetical protein
MDYGLLVRDAWLTTWRNRFLWVLGLFAGVTIGSLALGGYSLPLPTGEQVRGWTPELIQVGLLLALGGLAIAGVSAIARGSMTQATLAAEGGQNISVRQALSAGVRWFWRFLMLLVLLGLVALAIGGAVLLAIVNLGPAGGVLSALVLTLGAAASVVLAYAERAIVVHDLGPIAALRHGLTMFVEHPHASLLTWLLSVLLAVGVAELVALLLTSLTVVAATVVLVASAAIANAFFWSYWTLAYLRLESPATTA